MAFLGALLNPAQGAGFQAQGVTVGTPVSVSQARNATQTSQDALNQQQALVNQLQQQGGLQHQADVYGQQQALANQLGQMTQGGGPNPALAQLAQTTGQNAAQQAALMAGQRGSGANAGLIARQAAQQGGALQQQAAGQASTLRAQQQLAAIGALQNQQQALGNLATQQAGQQIGGTQFLNQAAQAQQQGLLGQVNAQNQANIANAQQQNAANASIAGKNADFQSGLFGGLLSGAGAGLSTAVGGGGAGASLVKGLGALALAEGGQVPGAADSSNFAPAMKEKYDPSRSRLSQYYFEGGKVKDMKSGGHVPGKAKIGGAKDSYSNDTVDAVLSPGEIVLPRSVTKSADPVTAAAKFVAALEAKKKGK